MCLFSRFDSMSFSAAACHYPDVFGRLWGQEVHLVNVECEIRIQSQTCVVNILFHPLRPPCAADLMYAAVPAGLLCAHKHASFCHAPAVQEKAGRCAHKSLIILLEGRPWLSSVSHTLPRSLCHSQPQIDLLACLLVCV